MAQLVEQANAGSPRPITLYLPDGTVLGPPIPVDAAVELARQGRSFTTAGPQGGRDVLVGLVGADLTAGTVVRVRVAASLLNRGVQRAWAIIAAVGCPVVVLAVGLTDRLALSMVRPMGELFSVTRRLQQGELGARVFARRAARGWPRWGSPSTGWPIASVTSSPPNEEEAADLSHQLRTPLTVLRLDAEDLASAEDRRRIAGASTVSNRSSPGSSRNRAAARCEQAGDRHGTCDLGQVVRQRLAFWSILASGQGRQWTVDVPSGRQPIGVSQAELEVCLDALLNNVLAHTPGGSSFSVEVIPGSGGNWMLVVQDAGPGLPGNTLPPRGASGGSGTGLGRCRLGGRRTRLQLAHHVLLGEDRRRPIGHVGSDDRGRRPDHGGRRHGASQPEPAGDKSGQRHPPRMPPARPPEG